MSNESRLQLIDAVGAKEALRETEQFVLPFTTQSKLAAIGRVWLLVADQSDAAQIADYLSSEDASGHTGFFISVYDGSHAIADGDILALRFGGEIRVFLAGAPRGAWIDQIAAERAKRAFAGHDHAGPARAAEVLLVRLIGNGNPLPGRNADGLLARTLRALQEADQAIDARFVAETAGNLLSRMPKAASGAVAGILSRLRAGALFTLCRSLFGYASEMLPEAIGLYRQAGSAVDAAGLRAQASACHRYARVLDDLARHASGDEPLLPGIVAQPDVEPAIPRLAFRALRCLAIPLGGDRAQGTAGATALGFREVGSLRVSDDAMQSVLGEIDTLNVIPRITVSELRGRAPARRVRVAFDREHFALLGLEDRRGAATGRAFSVFVQGEGWSVTPSMQSTECGRTANFIARQTAGSGAPLRVVIAAGSDVGTFEVPTSA